MVKISTKKIAIGTVIGGAVGYLAGILTAPKSGKETRKDIGDATIKAKHEAEKRLKQLHSELSKLLDQAKDRAGKVKNVAGKDYQAAVAKAQAVREKASQLLSGLHEGDANDKDLKKAIDDANSAIEHLKQFLTKDAS